MTGGREGSAPAEPLSRILSVGVLRCRRDSDKTRECFRKFGHKAGQAERPELPNAGGAGQEEPGNRRGCVWGDGGGALRTGDQGTVGWVQPVADKVPERAM